LIHGASKSFASRKGNRSTLVRLIIELGHRDWTWAFVAVLQKKIIDMTLTEGQWIEEL
jgi:hypothetical protein